MGRPATVDRRRILDTIFYVAGPTGCQWRALPGEYPNWNTRMHRNHLTWSKDGTWKRNR